MVVEPVEGHDFVTWLVEMVVGWKTSCRMDLDGCSDWGVGAGGGGGSGVEGYAQKEAMYHETAGCIYEVYV